MTGNVKPRYCNQVDGMGNGCSESWWVGGNYGASVCRNPAHHDPKPKEKPVSKPERSANSRAKVYEAIERAMAKYPDMRVGQLLVNAFPVVPDIFYVEDELVAKKIDAYVEANHAR